MCRTTSPSPTGLGKTRWSRWSRKDRYSAVGLFRTEPRRHGDTEREWSYLTRMHRIDRMKIKDPSSLLLVAIRVPGLVCLILFILCILVTDSVVLRASMSPWFIPERPNA